MDEIIEMRTEMLNLGILNNSTLKEQLCSPRFRNATNIGLFLALFQQLTGINIIFFFSSKYFD